MTKGSKDKHIFVFTKNTTKKLWEYSNMYYTCMYEYDMYAHVCNIYVCTTGQELHIFI